MRQPITRVVAGALISAGCSCRSERRWRKAWKRLDHFDASKGSFVNWVLGIAADVIADRGRQAERDRRDRTVAATIAISQQASDDPADVVSDGSDTAALLTAMDALSPRYQQVLSLRHMEQLSPSEIAAALDISPSVLAVTTHRAARPLQRELERIHGVEERS